MFALKLFLFSLPFFHPFTNCPDLLTLAASNESNDQSGSVNHSSHFAFNGFFGMQFNIFEAFSFRIRYEHVFHLYMTKEKRYIKNKLLKRWETGSLLVKILGIKRNWTQLYIQVFFFLEKTNFLHLFIKLRFDNISEYEISNRNSDSSINRNHFVYN